MRDYDLTKQVYVVFYIGCWLAARCVARRWRDPPFSVSARCVSFHIKLFVMANSVQVN